MSDTVTLILASSQTIVAVFAIVFTAVIYWDKARLVSELAEMRVSLQEFGRQESLDRIHAQQVQEFAEAMLIAHLLAWPIIEEQLRTDTDNPNVQTIVKRHKESVRELTRLRHELGLFTQDASKITWNAKYLVDSVGDANTLMLLQRILSNVSEERKALLLPHYESLHKRIVGLPPYDSYLWTGHRQ